MPTKGKEGAGVMTIQERNEKVMANIKLVKKLAFRAMKMPTLASSMGSFDDAVQIGTIALMRAADLYDPAKGAFSTYACWAIRTAFANAGSEMALIRIPHGCWSVEARNKARRAAAERACCGSLTTKQGGALPSWESEPVIEAGRREISQAVQNAVRSLTKTDAAVMGGLFGIEQEELPVGKLASKIGKSRNTVSAARVRGTATLAKRLKRLEASL